MLRTITVDNFIHFHEKKTLNFDRDTYFLIGANNTGKSSLLEGIRRCLSVSKNNGVSSPHDPTRLSYITCQFCIKEDYEVRQIVSSIVSSMIRIPFEGKDPLYVKVVRDTCESKQRERNTSSTSEDEDKNLGKRKRANKGEDDTQQSESKRKKTQGASAIKTIRVYADIVYKNKNGILVCQSIDFIGHKDIEGEAVDNIPLNIAGKLMKNEMRLRTLIESQIGDGYKETACDKKLKETVDHFTIIIYPFRSISPYQSSETQTRAKKTRGYIARKVSWKANVLHWYLEMGTKIEEAERQRERRFFNIMTAESDIEFKIDKDGIISVEKPSKHHPLLLKIPEGIYEAKVLAVLLAVRRYNTVCIDDAERGMHPQMIERIRDYVLPLVKAECSDKVVILITHNPAFMASQNIRRMILFQKTMVQTQPCFEMTVLKDKLTPVVDEKTLDMVTNRASSCLFCANHTIFVEGKSDELFLQHAFQLLVLERELLLLFVSEEERHAVEHVVLFLTGFSIIRLDGSPNFYKYRDFCRTLNIVSYFLLDHDVLNNNIPKDKPPGKSNEELVIGALGINVDASELPHIVSVLETEKIFVWGKGNESASSSRKSEDSKTGQIEGVVNELFKKNNKKVPENCFGTKKKKFLLHKDCNADDQRSIVRQCLQMAVMDTTSDFYRLIRFFIKHSGSV